MNETGSSSLWMALATLGVTKPNPRFDSIHSVFEQLFTSTWSNLAHFNVQNTSNSWIFLGLLHELLSLISLTCISKTLFFTLFTFFFRTTSLLCLILPTFTKVYCELSCSHKQSNNCSQDQSSQKYSSYQPFKSDCSAPLLEQAFWKTSQKLEYKCV